MQRVQRIAEVSVACMLAVGVLWNAFPWIALAIDPADPESLYYENFGIRLLIGISTGVDLAAIALWITLVSKGPSPGANGLRRILILLIALAAVSPWVEMWYGSTF